MMRVLSLLSVKPSGRGAPSEARMVPSRQMMVPQGPIFTPTLYFTQRVGELGVWVVQCVYVPRHTEVIGGDGTGQDRTVLCERPMLKVRHHVCLFEFQH